MCSRRRATSAPMKDVVTADDCDVRADSSNVDSDGGRVRAERSEVAADCRDVHPGEHDVGSHERELGSGNRDFTTTNHEIIADEPDLLSRDHVVITANHVVITANHVVISTDHVLHSVDHVVDSNDRCLTAANDDVDLGNHNLGMSYREVMPENQRVNGVVGDRVVPGDILANGADSFVCELRHFTSERKRVNALCSGLLLLVRRRTRNGGSVSRTLFRSRGYRGFAK